MDNDQEEAMAGIEALGGTVESDEGSSGKPGIRVNLGFLPVTDAGLERLKGLARLRWLDLERTRVTDAGLECLKGLTQLRRLDLWDTQVTEAGVEGLQGALPDTRIYPMARGRD
jgi:hypothetical protein